MFYTEKCSIIYAVYFMNSCLPDAPGRNFQFYLFLVRSFWYKSKQSQFFYKIICGGLPFCKTRYCSI